MNVLWKMDFQLINTLNQGFQVPLHTLRLLKSLKNHLDSNEDTLNRTAQYDTFLLT